MKFVAYAAKAFFAALVALLGGLAAVVTGDENLGDITVAQWIAIALATIIAGGGVFRIPNASLTSAPPAK